VTFELDPARILLLGGLVLGFAFGALVQARHFCIMGAIADLVLFGSARRLRVWLLAIATAILGTQLSAAAGLVPLAESGHLAPRLALGPALLGGLLFGFGMVLTGGCASRSLVRAASGSLKSLVVLLVMGLAAWTASLGLLAPAHGLVRELGTVPLAGGEAAQALWRPLSALGLDAGPARLLAALALAGGLLAFVLADPRLRASRVDLATGAVLGLLVVAAWLATGWLAADPFEPPAPGSLSYVGPVAQSLALVATGGTSAPFGPALVVGTLLGAAALAPFAGGFRLEGFVSGADLARHLVGAALMGVGGAVAMGCTIGQGLSGLSTLSATSLVATLAIVAGAAWALRFLESGRLLPRLTPAVLLRAVVAGPRAGPPWRTTSGGDM
jgi:uncharacterized membrane protein YedE/YeeE